MRIFILLISLFAFVNGSGCPILMSIPGPAMKTPGLKIAGHLPVSASELATMKLRDLEKLTGCRFTLIEKLAFKIYQAKLKKQNRKAIKTDTPKRSKIAFILSLLSLATVVLIPLSLVLAVISILLAAKSIKQNEYDRKAKTAMGLSILAIGIIVVGLMIYGIFISDGAFKIFIIN
jgi:hypothetical protein